LFLSAGGLLLDEHPVTEIIPGQEVTVRTTKATFRTKKLIITAGSWTSDLLKTLGLELPLKVCDLLGTNLRG
jgi:glycine/D-amino acid oxidase-like deaminating enzyme